MNKELKEQIGQIVNRYDPINLLKIGAPIDEYEQEVLSILILLTQYKDITEKEVEMAVKKLFSEKFSSQMVEANQDVFSSMAADLHKLLSSK